MPTFELEICDQAQDRICLRVSGEIDLSTAPELLASMLCAAEVYPDRAVVVDFASVSFLDSAGIAALVRAHRVIAPVSGLFVMNARPNVRQVLDLTGVSSFLCLGAPELHSGAGLA